MKSLILLIGLILMGCSVPCHNYPFNGPSEFVIDSYKIRQGKLSIMEMEGKFLEEVPCIALNEYEDVIVEDDVLNIAIYHPTRKDMMESINYINHTVGGFKVKNGAISLPDISPIIVEGLTLEEARLEIQKEFQKQIEDTEVFLTYNTRLARKVELTGLVAIDQLPVNGKIRLYEVLAKAKIPPHANLYKSYVLRNGEQLAIDLHKLVNEGDMCQNIVMRGGDKIYIAPPCDSKVMVMGEVGMPRAIDIPYGYISLREALVQARGIPFTGDKRNIQVIRGNIPCPKIYCLSWEHIVHLPNDSLLLMPGDTVYVSEKPITKWNRFIQQLLPSATGIQTGYALYELTKECN